MLLPLFYFLELLWPGEVLSAYKANISGRALHLSAMVLGLDGSNIRLRWSKTDQCVTLLDFAQMSGDFKKRSVLPTFVLFNMVE